MEKYTAIIITSALITLTLYFFIMYYSRSWEKTNKELYNEAKERVEKKYAGTSLPTYEELYNEAKERETNEIVKNTENYLQHISTKRKRNYD